MPRRNDDIVIEISPDVFKTVALAAFSGVRSVAPPALLSRAAAGGDLPGLRGTRFAPLASGGVSKALQTMMVGEMLGDKTSFIPSRISPGPLFGRALSGALVGSALFVSGGREGLPGALLGVASALAGVYAADRLRSSSTQRLGLPDPVFGLLEDAVVLLAGSYLLRADS